jgi:hypothetical protein
MLFSTGTACQMNTVRLTRSVVAIEVDVTPQWNDIGRHWPTATKLLNYGLIGKSSARCAAALS